MWGFVWLTCRHQKAKKGVKGLLAPHGLQFVYNNLGIAGLRMHA